MANTCCGDGIAFAGWNSGDKIQKDIVSFIFVKTIADDNSKNGILKTEVMNKSFTDALFNHADKSKRWNSVNDLLAFDDTPTDPNFIQDSNGGNHKVSGGSVKTVKSEIWKKSARYGKQIAPFLCGDNQSFYGVDSCGVLVGENSKDGLSFLPFPISRDTGFITSLGAKSGDVTKLMLQFDIKATSNPLDTILISNSVIEADLTQHQSIERVNGIVTVPLATGFTLQLNGNFGYTKEENKIVGLLVGDFTLKTSAGVPVVPASVTAQSDPKGNFYDFVATIPSGDYTIEALKEGYELLPLSFTVA